MLLILSGILAGEKVVEIVLDTIFNPLIINELCLGSLFRREFLLKYQMS